MNPQKLRTSAPDEARRVLRSSLDAAATHLKRAALSPVVGDGAVRAKLSALSDRCASYEVPDLRDVPHPSLLAGHTGTAEELAAFHFHLMAAAQCLDAKVEGVTDAVGSGALRSPAMRRLMDVASRIGLLAFRLEEAFETALVAEFGSRSKHERFPFARPEEPDFWMLFVERGEVRRALP